MADIEKKELTAAEKKADKKAEKKAAKKDKVSLGKKIAKFFRDLNSERKKIVYPGKELTFKNFALVLVVVVVCGVVIGLLDYALFNGFVALGKLL